jgi:hypothetical protein
MNQVFQAGPPDMAERFVMLAIADNADDTGFAFPGVDVIATKSCQSVRNTLRVLKQLEVGGWLIIKRRCQGPKNQGNGYQLNLAMMAYRSDTVSSRTPHDAMASRTKERVAKKDAYKAPHDTVSPDVEIEIPSDKQTTSEVTSESIRSDKSCFPILINHQEPSLEPKDSPLPPSGGRDIKSAFVSKDPAAQLTTLMSLLTPAAARTVAAAPMDSKPTPEESLRNPMLLGRWFLEELHEEFARAFATPQASRSNWDDPLDAWQRCFEHVRVAEVETPEGDESGYVVVLETPRPRDLADGLAKYKAKVTIAMNKAFGTEVQLIPRMETT